jgi:hypothetical protein
VQAFATILQRVLGRTLRSNRLSRKGAVSESFSILSVVYGLRTSSLLSTLIASHSNLVALQDALTEAGAYEVIVLVHESSQQIFVVNKTTFLHRYNDIEQRNLFYAVDATIKTEQERIQVSSVIK